MAGPQLVEVQDKDSRIGKLNSGWNPIMLWLTVVGNETLRAIAGEVVRQNATINWAQRESVRAGLRAMIKRVLRQCEYPPDKQESATRTVLEQAERLGADWAA